MKRLSLLLFFTSIFFYTTAIAQSNDEPSGTFGLGVSIQSQQSDINVPIWVNENVIFSPSFSLFYSEDIGNDLGLGFLIKYYFDGTTEEVRPYAGARFGLLIFNPDADIESSTDILWGPAIGADYFIHSNVSFGAEAQLNFATTDENSSRFGVRNGTTVNTAAALTMSIYF